MTMDASDAMRLRRRTTAGSRRLETLGAAAVVGPTHDADVGTLGS